MIKVRNEKLDEAVFMKMREKELSAWPTGREIDLDEAIEYQKSLPPSKNYGYVLQQYKKEGKCGLSPRSGVPVVEEEIKLLHGLYDAGVRLFPFTTDSYTRNCQFERAQQGLEESIRTGQKKLNGFPIINHGVKTTRRVVESVDGAFDPRCSKGANNFVAEMAFASGMTAMPHSFFGWLAGYDKLATPEECVESIQYMGRLIGYYAEHGVILSTDLHGWIPNGVIPMYICIATQIIEGIVAATQGVRSLMPLVNFQGNLAQDLGDFRAIERMYDKYLKKTGHEDTVVAGLIGQQSPLFAFPSDVGRAFGYINYVAMCSSLAKLPACSVKTIDEATGVPSIESHMQTYRSANWIFDVMSEQKFKFDSKQADIEQEMTEKAVSAIIDKVYEMGDGDVCVGVVKAVEAGVLDSPFSVNVNVRDLCLGARDLYGACRYIDFGNLPIPEEVKEFHREKIHEREKAEGTKIDYKYSLADFWSLSRGMLCGKTEKSEYEGAIDSFHPAIAEKKPTIITGTSGVDSHVIGTKIISRELRDNGFNVVALGAQTPPEEFIKAAQETNASAILITSLYGMAEMDLQGFRDKCIEAGVGDILLYIGGILGVGVHDFQDDVKIFKKIGFDRVYPPEADVKKSVLDLCNDLTERGIL